MITLLQKVWFDLWGNKSRTLQVVLVIALGSIAIGLVIGGRNLISEAVTTSYANAEPSHIKLSVNPPLTREQIERVAKIEGVAEVEGLLSGSIEWRFPGEEEWQTARIKGRDSYQEQLMGPEGILEGIFPGRNTIGIGQISVGSPQIFVGDTIEIRSGDRQATYEVVGLLDPIGPEPVFGETIYVDQKTFTRITGRDAYNLIQLRDSFWDPANAERTDLLIQDYFEEINVDSVGVSFPFQDRIVPPDVNPASAILNALFLILGIIGVVVVILGIFLVYNSVSAIVSQQTSQIGVMKAIGASSLQVAWSYLVLVMGYGVLAMFVSLPIGGAAALGLQTFFGNFLNLESNPIRVDPVAVGIQILICLIAPLLAALIPLLNGMRISVREAIGSYGLTGALGLVNRLVARFTNLSYTILLTIANTFRNQKRVIIIQIALIVAGTIFMMVLGVNDASQFTYDGKLKEVHTYQVAFSTDQLTRVEILERAALSVDGVTDVESWQVTGGSARPISQPEKEVTDARISIFGQPPETTFYKPEIFEGRWLNSSDTYAVVAGSQVSSEKGWQVGDQIVLTENSGREMTVEIVGIHFDPAAGGTSLHLPLAVLQREWGQFQTANAVFVKTTQTDAEFQTAIASQVETALESQNVGVRPSSPFGENTIAEISATLSDGLDIIITLLAVMAVVIALVGGVGLSGVLSLSVLERRREIGVMRAIGASSGQVIRLFIQEGILLGWLSWIVAIPLSIPAAWYLATRGLAFALNTNLAYRFSFSGPLIWLAIITVLAIVASVFPARGAAKISVRESLSYS
ncbi:MAG: FtsX-like permease family protein [Ardenticatenaceae bacterium]|nr:FtsX-like permease family protein [Ardenticatenaceae bacterium]